MLVSGVRMTVLSGREEMCGGQDAGGGRLAQVYAINGLYTCSCYVCEVCTPIALNSQSCNSPQVSIRILHV